MLQLDTRNFRNIVVLTGAGISAGSGLRTYRGLGGLWSEMDPESFSTAESLTQDLARVWPFYSDMRSAALAAAPNAAHRVLAQLRLAPGASFTLVTQNVDGLHQQAGSVDVVELHGSAFRTRCSNARCTLPPFRDSATYRDQVPTCTLCGAALRPDVVGFGEPLPIDAEMRIKRALRNCDLFLAIGTSGTVAPASNFVRGADYAGALTVYVNLEPMVGENRYFKHVLLGKAEDVLPALFAPALG